MRRRWLFRVMGALVGLALGWMAAGWMQGGGGPVDPPAVHEKP